ncbi:MAG TPA: dihydrodipicolinate reductase C-terminal domain-containing protein [Blastocatellia bacterium]|nr:dihydrodipicolinate reductase C-terminal domain-containing protein [Blastocatellia bacterium]
MRIALFGYGKMGRLIEELAVGQGHEIAAILDPEAGSRGDISQGEVAIDFTEPGAVLDNVSRACQLNLPMVIGTTGWYARLPEARDLVDAAETGLVYGPNFSLGVNVMFKLAELAAELFKPFSSYDAFIEEAHHKFKKDAPSGTALTLRQLAESRYGRPIPCSSTRAGHIPGTHRLGFDSVADTLEITHVARSRAGFAEGALLAASWIKDRKGCFEFKDIIEQLF